MQAEIDFTATAPAIVPHTRENNPESENHLTEYQGKFSKKMKELLKRLVTGERLQFANEVKTIGDLRRRSLDLIELNGGTADNPTIPVQRTFIELTEEQKLRKVVPVKEYWLKESDISWVRVKYRLILLS